MKPTTFLGRSGRELSASHIWPKEGQIWGTKQYSPLHGMSPIRALLDVDAGDAGGQAAEDFVGDGVGDAGEVVGADGAVRGASDEQDFVAERGGGDVGDVDHGEVHADV